MTPLVFGRRPIPWDDELLSSYLVRLASLTGMSPHRLGTEIGSCQIWTRDIDRSASASLISDVARYNGMNPDVVHALTLESFESILSGSSQPRRRQGIASWINAVGVFHRIRRLHGLQYCPACLSDTPGYRRIWRLSFVTVCVSHQIALRDSCPHCDSPIIPHRSLQAGLRCHFCHRPFNALKPTISAESAASTALQKLFLDTCGGTSPLLGNEVIGSEVFFPGAAQILQVAKSKLVKAGGSARQDSARFEFLRTDARAHYSSLLYELLADWPYRFIGFAEKHNISQACFSKFAQMPAWIGKIVHDLPARIRERKVSRQPRLADAHVLRGHESWRTVRARRLLRAARSKS